MSTPTANEVIVMLSKLGRELDVQQDEISRLDRLAVDARARYKTTYARAFVKAEGAEGLRKALATIEAADAELDAEIADQVLRAAKESIRVLRDRLDIGRSLNSAIRSEWSAQGSQGMAA